MSYSPFYYELILSKPVLFDGNFTYTDSELIIELEKEVHEAWEHVGRYPTKEESKIFR